jgi:uncharacterized protein
MALTDQKSWSASFLAGCASTREIIGKLKENENALRTRGVAWRMWRCSVPARGDKRPGSDIDIMIEIAPEAPVAQWEYTGLKEKTANLLEGLVDVANREGLKPNVRPTARRPTQAMPSGSPDATLRIFCWCG